MSRLTPQEITALFVALGAMLGAARILGELARRFRQPAVLGEILAGVLLGPTVLGRIAPGFSEWLFPKTGGGALFLNGFATLAAALFLLVAGMEVELGRVWRQGRAAVLVSTSGIVIPFGLGFLAAHFAPRVLGSETDADPLVFSLFFATALSISALPVIARTLMDLNLFRTDMGMVVIAAAMVEDLIGWIVFAVILGMIGTSAGHGLPIGATIGLTLAFAATTLTLGRWLVHRSLPWIQAHASWPGGEIGFALCLALLAAAATEWIGVHAIFGTFMAGVAIGDSPRLRERTRATIGQFISFIFAPIFFASVGLRVDFIAKFDPTLVLVVLVIACAGKILGASLGARLGGMGRREALSIGYAMNARGAMEIVLGMLALDAGVIRERMFVALVVMALVTSVMSGPLIQRTMGRTKRYSLRDFLSPRGFVGALRADTREEAIRELSDAVGPSIKRVGEALARAAVERERLVSSGIENGLAIPSARIPMLAHPVVGVGLSRAGIDFNAPDGGLAHIVFLVLTPRNDPDAQWGLFTEIGRVFAAPETRERVLEAASFTELLVAVNTEVEDDVRGGPRSGVLIVGASPTARALGKRMAASGVPVRLVDRNRENCQAAQRDGLFAVEGDALRDTVLFQAHAFEAETIVAMTMNADVNAAVAHAAHEEFGVPRAIVVRGEDGAGAAVERPGAPGTSLLRTAQLASIDRWLAEGAAEWQSLAPGPRETPVLDAYVATLGPELLPLLVQRGGALLLATRGMELQPGDELLALHRRYAQLEPHARLARAVERAAVLDLAQPSTLLETLRAGAREMALHLDGGLPVPEDERMLTRLAPWLYVGRMTSAQPQTFEVVLVRSRPLEAPTGCRALVLTASSADEGRTHVALLAQIAQHAQEPEIEARFAAALGASDLRAILLGAAAG